MLFYLADGNPSSILQEVEVDIISNSECSNSFAGITDGILCTQTPEGGKDSCVVRIYWFLC